VRKLVEVGSYTRDLGAALDRLIENALDWEHLPHLHDSSFAGIEVIEHGSDGWRANAWLSSGEPVTLDLRLHGAGWTTRTYAGERVTTEIRSVAEPTGPDSCRVHVRFLVADAAPDKHAAIGGRYRALYEQLYNEDERMMIARAEAIRRGPGALKLRRAAALPNGVQVQAPVYCPHQGLPLDADPDADGVITCPWHGYAVNIRSGQCTPPFTHAGT
jgi:phenylpropionate dioxygenase-like ring-hydroxylating dioxygenase large terminal subunit